MPSAFLHPRVALAKNKGSVHPSQARSYGAHVFRLFLRPGHATGEGKREALVPSRKTRAPCIPRRLGLTEPMFLGFFCAPNTPPACLGLETLGPEVGSCTRGRKCKPIVPTKRKERVLRPLFSFGRSDKIRTCDLLVPNQALYQAEPHPVLSTGKRENRERFPQMLIDYSTAVSVCQVFAQSLFDNRLTERGCVTPRRRTSR